MKTVARASVEAGLGRLTLEPEVPGKPPTLDFGVLDGIEAAVAAFSAAAARGELRAALVESASPKYFVVGANLEALKQVGPDSIGAWVERGHRVFDALASLPVPTFAVVRGHCLGGGLELAMACDCIAASDAARFGLPEASLGFVPGWGGVERLAARVGVPRAKELLATGRSVDAAEACRLGLAEFAGSGAELDGWLERTLAAVRSNSALALTLTKRMLDAGADRRSRSLLDEALASAACLSSGDTARRLEEFFRSREKKS